MYIYVNYYTTILSILFTNLIYIQIVVYVMLF